jgi:hypothetical protein
MTPTWADISKKATYRIKRQFQKMDKEAQKQAQLKKEQEAVYQNSMTHYLDQATSAVESIKEGLSDAIRQGLDNASKKKRKRVEPPPQQDNPNSLCTLSGEVVIANNQKASVELQSKSDFATAVLVLDTAPPAAVLLYYEVTLVTGGMAQIGWASLVGSDDDDDDDSIAPFTPNNDLGDGVGDDTASFAVDGSRGQRFHAGSEQDYPMMEWKAGDRLGCCLDTNTGTLSFTLNGKDLGKAFTTSLKSLVPAFSCNQGEILELHTTREDCRHFPGENAVAVGDLVDASSLVSDLQEEKPSTGDESSNVIEKESTEKTSPSLKSPPADSNPQSKADKKPAAKTEPPPKKEPVKMEPLDLDKFQSASELEALGLDRLKGALMALRVKCGYVYNKKRI